MIASSRHRRADRHLKAISFYPVRILYVDIDTLRADHCGPCGYGRTITPNIDQVAAGGVVMEDCYVSDSPCAPSRAALSAGQFGITTGAIANFGPAADIHFFERSKFAPFFGGHLYRNGIPTASISCFPERHMAYWFLGNFREWLKPSLSNGDDEDGADVTSSAVDWIRRKGRAEDWFLQVHFWDPHIPYYEPSRYYEMAIAAGAPPPWPDEEAIAAHGEIYGPHTALDLYEGDGTWSVPPPASPNPLTMPDSIRSRADFERLVNGYDGAVAYVDHQVGRLMDTLADLGVLDETAVVVTSDHGECLGEGGCYGDHPMANEASHHVPLVLRWPGVTDRAPTSAAPTSAAPPGGGLARSDLAEGSRSPARRVRGLVYQIDLCPTVCELLDIEVPSGWEGESFAGALRGEPFGGREHLVLSHGAYTYQRALRTRDHLYVRTLHPGMWRIEREQLYAVEDDPQMTRDLLTELPELAHEMAGVLEEWRSSHATMRADAPDPMEAGRYEGPRDAFYVPAYLERLRSTGRAHLAADLERRLEQPWVTSGRW